jgi:predicted NBD/HSP70 family sugar kinase
MKNKAGDQSIVRIANQKTIIEYLREKGPMSKADLAKMLKISKPTVAKNVEELISKKILYEYGEGISSGGRKPLLISFNKTYKYILSLEININHPRIALFDLDGGIIKTLKIEINKKIKEKKYFEKIYFEINQLIEDQEIKEERIGIISVSTPGIIDEKSGEITANPQFKEWETINLINELNKIFGKKVIVKNDISMAALGEKHYGIGKQFNNLIYISSTLGVGAGLIINGKLYEGIRKAAGEIGYFVEKENLDSNESFESLYSIPNIINKIQLELKNNKNSILYGLTDKAEKEVKFPMVIECIKLKDQYILDVIGKVALSYAVIINNISILLDLECVIIGGYLAEFGVVFTDIISDIINKKSPIKVEILTTKLKETASLYGTYIVGNDYLTKNMIK